MVNARASLRNVLRLSPAWMSVGAPIVTLVLIVIMLSFTLVSGFARQQDAAFADNSQRLVQNALRERVRALKNIAVDYAIWNDAYRATTLRWDARWLDENYYSSVADALFVLTTNGEIRYVWLGPSQSVQAQAIADALRRGAAHTDFGVLARRQDNASFASFAVVAGQPAIVSFAPIAPEHQSLRLRHAPPPTRFLAVIDVLDANELAAIGASLELHDLAFATRETDDRRSITFAISDAQAAPVGAFIWRDERPGSAAFLGRIWPIVVCLMLIGALTILIARRLATAHVQAQIQTESAQEASRLKSEFIATMSHELRTPLNTIIGYTELIQEQASTLGEAGQTVGEDADHVLEGAKHLSRLVNNILDQSRIDAGRLKLASEPVEVAEILAELEELMLPMARANVNRFEVRAESDIGAVKADPVRLQQCLVNLTGNALKFTHAGGVRVIARRVAQSETIAFEVSDTGVGIDGAELDRLFQPFPIPNIGGGTGLSLSITRSLARVMGGDVVARSVLGEGSTFTLTLPAAEHVRSKAVA